MCPQRGVRVNSSIFCNFSQTNGLLFFFLKSVRTGNYELYVNVLPFINNIFFSLNLFNYARWTARYHDNLLKVDSTHPGLREKHFNKGSFSVRRTGKDFSRQPTDFVIEETQNADAASSAGVSNLSDSPGGRQRWCINHTTHTEVNSHIYDICGMKIKQDISSHLGNSNIKMNCKLIAKLKNEIVENMNPFGDTLDIFF